VLKKLSFRTRLLLGFILILILVLGTISFSLSNALNISKLIKQLQESPRTVGLTIQQLKSNSLKINELVHQLLILDDEGKASEIHTKIIQLEKQISSDFDLIEDRYSGNEEDVKDAKKTYNDWKMIREEALDYLKSGDHSQATQIVNSLCSDYIELLSSKYRIIKTNSFKTATEYFKKIELQIHKNMSRMLFVSVFIILMAIIITIVVSNSISKPIKKLLKKTIDVHKIKLDKSSSQFDEQGLLESTIEELNIYYDKLKVNSDQNKEDKQTIEEQLEKIKKQAEELRILNSELENKVLLRTEEVAKSFEELEENRDILKSYLDSSPDAIIVFDENAKLTFASEGAFSMFKIDKDINIKTVNIFDFIDPSEKEKVGNNINQLKEMGEMSNPEVKLVRKDRTTFYAQTRSRLVKNKEGKLLFFMVAQDITKRKESQRKLKESEKRYRNMFENSINAILIIENNKFINCNNATIKLLGYNTKDEFLNTHPSELSPEKQPDGQFSSTKADEMIELALKNKNHRFKWNHKKADGTVFPVEVTLATLENEKDHKVLFTIWREI